MRIFLDCDELLADFVGGACRVWGVRREEVQAVWEPGLWDCIVPIGRVLEARGSKPLTASQFWKRIDAEGEAFWAGLHPLPWMPDLVAMVEEFGGSEGWDVVSSPPISPLAWAGKVVWLRNTFGPSFDRFALTRRKHLLAGRGKVLIDDRESNVEAFIEAGGSGILFPAHQNSLHRLKADPLADVRRNLEVLATIDLADPCP